MKNWHYRGLMTIEQLVPEALKLPSRERALLAASLWESLEDPYELAALTETEAIRLAWQRDAEIQSGLTIPLSHADLMQRLRA
jgi:hypothetical protein